MVYVLANAKTSFRRIKWKRFPRFSGGLRLLDPGVYKSVLTSDLLLKYYLKIFFRGAQMFEFFFSSFNLRWRTMNWLSVVWIMKYSYFLWNIPIFFWTVEREHAEEEFKKVPVSPQNPFITGSQSPEGSRKLTPQGDAATRGHWQSPGNSAGASQKCAPPPAVYWGSLAAAAGGTPTSHLSASLPAHCPVSRVLRFRRTTYTMPKKHLHLPLYNQQLTSTQVPSSSVSSDMTRPPPVSLGFPVQSRPPPTNAMRQSICRNFTKILCKRWDHCHLLYNVLI